MTDATLPRLDATATQTYRPPGATLTELAAYTGRSVDDTQLQAVLDPALDYLDRHYILADVADAVVREAHKATVRWLLQAQRGELVSDEFGTTYLPRHLPVVDKLLRRRGGFA